MVAFQNMPPRLVGGEVTQFPPFEIVKSVYRAGPGLPFLSDGKSRVNRGSLVPSLGPSLLRLVPPPLSQRRRVNYCKARAAVAAAAVGQPPEVV